MQERNYRAPIQDVVELRQLLIETWIEFQQSIVDDAIVIDSVVVFAQRKVTSSTC